MPASVTALKRRRGRSERCDATHSDTCKGLSVATKCVQSRMARDHHDGAADAEVKSRPSAGSGPAAALSHLIPYQYPVACRQLAQSTTVRSSPPAPVSRQDLGGSSVRGQVLMFNSAGIPLTIHHTRYWTWVHKGSRRELSHDPAGTRGTRRLRFSLLLAATIGIVLDRLRQCKSEGDIRPDPLERAPEWASRPAASAPIHHLPSGAPAPTVLPTATEATTPEPAPAIEFVAVAPLTIDVWNAEERYFSVVGSTPSELVASAEASVPADRKRSRARHDGVRRAESHGTTELSYVLDPATGSSTMTGVASSVVYQATRAAMERSLARTRSAACLVVGRPRAHPRAREPARPHLRAVRERSSGPHRRPAVQLVGCDHRPVVSRTARRPDRIRRGRSRLELPTYTGVLDW